MKTLKFKSDLADQIIAGTKTTTWRLFDDKSLQVGDELEFFNSDTQETFGEAKIVDIKETTLGKLIPEDFDGHESYTNDDEMYETYREYYGDKVGPDTELKIIKFEFYTTIL